MSAVDVHVELVCFLNRNGHCIERVEFPNSIGKPCRFNVDGCCMAKQENLMRICHFCGESHDFGECPDGSDFMVMPNG
jgi:hypothetical protein